MLPLPSDPMRILSLLLSLVAAKAEEPACLLQKPQASSLLALAPAVPGWQFAGTGSCDPAAILGSFIFFVSVPADCATQCLNVYPASTAFSIEGAPCVCCQGLRVGTGTALTYARTPTSWQFLGAQQTCPPGQIVFSAGVPSLDLCAQQCDATSNVGWMIYSSGTCVCCGAALQGGGTFEDLGYQLVTTAGVHGDPHITALDGSHYLLLSEGTFSLWHLHGLSTEIQSEDGAGPQEFRGNFSKSRRRTASGEHAQSFTKGLLLVDRSAGVQRQFLEITSQDCQWRARAGAEWSLVSEPGMISVDGQDYVTGFNMTKTGRKNHGGHRRSQLSLNQVHLSMNSKDGATDIAVLTVSCRPKRNLDLNLVMNRRADQRFVDGELAARKTTFSTLQTYDAEFNIKGKWQDIGGSPEAEAYLRQTPSTWRPWSIWTLPASSSTTACMTFAMEQEKTQQSWQQSS
eukprot:s57_g41.t1